MNAPERAPQIPESNAYAAERQADDFDRLLQKAYSPRDMLEGDGMDKMFKLAEQMATSKLSVPEHLRGNVGDCLAIVTQAMLWNMNPFAVAQKTHIVSGRLGYEAQLVNAVVQNSGAVRGAPRYEYHGEGMAMECRVGFVLRGESEITWGEWLKNGDVTTRNSPLWKVNPKQQLGYLQIKNWARAFCPGAILGVYTTDELEQLGSFPDGDGVIPEPAAPRGPQRKSASRPPAGSAADAEGAAPPPPAASAAPAPRAEQAAPKPAAGDSALTTGQVAYLRNKIKAAGLQESTFHDRFNVSAIEALTSEQFDAVKAELLAMA